MLDAVVRYVASRRRHIPQSPIVFQPTRVRTRIIFICHLGPDTHFLRNDNTATATLRSRFIGITHGQYVLVASPSGVIGHRERVRARFPARVFPIVVSYAAL